MVLSTLDRVQKQVFCGRRLWRMGKETEAMCDRHARKKQADRGKRELSYVVPTEVVCAKHRSTAYCAQKVLLSRLLMGVTAGNRTHNVVRPAVQTLWSGSGCRASSFAMTRMLTRPGCYATSYASCHYTKTRTTQCR